MAFIRKKITVALLGLLALVGTALYVLADYPPFAGNAGGLGLDLARPDALIRSCSLSRLPPDLLRVPLARDVLTEDFVDYYEHNENRDSLLGTLKRLAYEHRLSLSEQVIETVFDEPAEVALWRDKNGRLTYFALVMTRNMLAKTLGLLLPLSDRQVTTMGNLRGTQAPVLLLEYGYQHRLALIFQGDRVVALSDLGMLLAENQEDVQEAKEEAADAETETAATGEASPYPKQSEAAAAVIAELLNKKAKVSVFARHFGLDKAPSEKSHEIILGTPAFAFGYEHFMPALGALKFTFDDKGGWQSAALIDDGDPAVPADFRSASTDSVAADRNGLWAALPYGAGLCAALPVAWPRLQPLLRDLDSQGPEELLPPELLASMSGRVATCWYREARYYSPLLVATFAAAPDETRDDAQVEEQVKAILTLADATLNVGAGRIASFDKESRQGTWLASAKDSDGKVRVKSISSTYPLTPALIVSGKKLVFSPDHRLAEKAMDVEKGKYPALADIFPDGAGETLATIDPAALAALLRQEIYASLPPGEAQDFRDAAEYYLEPRLEALAARPAQRVLLAAPKKGSKRKAKQDAAAAAANYEWRTLTWEPLKKSRQ